MYLVHIRHKDLKPQKEPIYAGWCWVMEARRSLVSGEFLEPYKSLQKVLSDAGRPIQHKWLPYIQKWLQVKETSLGSTFFSLRMLAING